MVIYSDTLVVGVEQDGEQEDENDIYVNEDSFSDIVTWSTDWTVESLINQLRRKIIDLDPSFQRRNAWDVNKKSKLIESIILGLPVPEIVLAESKNENRKFIVIDGKQRLLTIQQFAGISDNEEVNDINNKNHRFRLKNLDIIKELNGLSYSDLIEKPEYDKYLQRFETSTIRTIVIKNWSVEAVLYKIFHRLNTGSLKLSPQELRQALHPGPFLDYADEYSQQSVGLRKILKLKAPDTRMQDVELFIRYFALRNYMSSYEGNLKKFLDSSCESLNKLYPTTRDIIKQQAFEFEEAISATYDIFEKDAFHKHTQNNYTNIFNRAVYDIMIYYFSDPTIRMKAISKSVEVKEAFEELSNTDSEFLKAFEASTKDKSKISKRFTTWGDKLTQILGMDVHFTIETSNVLIDLDNV